MNLGVGYVSPSYTPETTGHRDRKGTCPPPRIFLSWVRVRPVAFGAIFWRGFVEQDQLALNLALQRVTHRAGYICVAACQRELSALIVVKFGGGPALIHVAICAFCNSILGNELVGVWIRVARFAILWRPFELNFVGAGGCLVTFSARGAAMSAEQSKLCFRMVEAADVDPGLGAVTGFAAQSGSIGAFLRHALLEFALVWIRVAGRAGAVREMERQNLVCSSAKARLVAIRAGDGHVSTG